jgi:Rad3-related DNA helicase
MPIDDGHRATILAADKGVSLIIEAVRDEARIHFDIETDDLAAEIRRIEQLGGKKIKVVDHTVIMEAPTGHRFRLTGPQLACACRRAAMSGETTNAVSRVRSIQDQLHDADQAIFPIREDRIGLAIILV